ncbi:AAA family ATPase [Allopusillimonas ginsengisoli]|uniref:AAA family ATPase n=1 Tax=Allopusillimonas ginsengisoli TaxID=453575 RepID=UPI0039C4A232
MNGVVIPIITPDSFDFRAYMAESEPKAKVLGADTWRNALIESVRSGDKITGARLPWPSTYDNLRFRSGEVTLWQGINGHGKSQLLGQACIGFANQGEPVCLASFEMKPVSTLKRMLRQVAMNDRPTEKVVNSLMDWAKGRFWLYDQLGTVKPEMIYAVIRYCADKLKIKHIVIDSLMKCVRGEDDYNGQKDFVDMLTGLARDLEVHIHLVHHVRKGENEEKVPGKFDSKGSGAIADQVDQVLTVWRNKKKERAIEVMLRQQMQIDDETRKKPDALLICDKNRHGEWEGSTALWYHPQSLQYIGDKRCVPTNMVGL